METGPPGVSGRPPLHVQPLAAEEHRIEKGPAPALTQRRLAMGRTVLDLPRKMRQDLFATRNLVHVRNLFFLLLHVPYEPRNEKISLLHVQKYYAKKDADQMQRQPMYYLYEPRREKTNVLVSDLTRHLPTCTATEDG